MELKLHTSFPDELESAWNLLLERSVLHVPFLRYEYLRAWWQTRGGGEWREDVRLAIVTGWEGDDLCGVAPLFFCPDFEGDAALLLLGSIQISDYLDLIAPAAKMKTFIESLLPFLANGGGLPPWRSLYLHNLVDTSPTLMLLDEFARQQQWIFSTRTLQHSPYIPLPDSFEAYLARIDKKQRHEIRRKMRRTGEVGQPVRYYYVQERARLDKEIEDFLVLMAYDEQKRRFLTPPMREHMRLTMHCAFDQDCLHLAFLEVGGEKAAGHLSFDYLKRIWAYNSGVNPKFAYLSPGWVLLGYELQWAIAHQKVEYDFMRGDEEYKYRFGAVDRYVMQAVLTPT